MVSIGLYVESNESSKQGAQQTKDKSVSAQTLIKHCKFQSAWKTNLPATHQYQCTPTLATTTTTVTTATSTATATATTTPNATIETTDDNNLKQYGQTSSPTISIYKINKQSSSTSILSKSMNSFTKKTKLKYYQQNVTSIRIKQTTERNGATINTGAPWWIT